MPALHLGRSLVEGGAGVGSHTWTLTSLAYFSSSNCSILAFSAL